MTHNNKQVTFLNKLAGAASWSLVDQLSGPFIALALVPYMLRNMGPEQYGIWVLSMSLLVLMPFVSLGSSAALIKEISHRQHNIGRVTVERLISCSLAIVLCGGAVLVLVSLVGVSLFSLWAPEVGIDSLEQLVVLTAIVIAVSEIDNVFASSLRGLGRFDLAAQIEIAGRGIWALVIVVVTAKAGSAHAVLIVTLGLTILKSGVKAWAVQRLIRPHTAVWWPRFSKLEAPSLVSFGGWTMVHTLAGLLFYSADRWLIAAILGPTSLALYNICFQFAQLPHTLLAAALQVIVPSVSRALGANNVESLSRKGMRGAAWIAAVSLAVPAILAILTPDILTHWISPEFATQNVDLTLLLLLGFTVLCISIPPHFMLIGLGDVRFVSQLNLFAGCACTFLLLVLNLADLQEFAAVRIVYGLLLLTTWWRLFYKLRCLTRSA